MPRRASVALLVATLALVGCGGGEKPAPPPAPTPKPAPKESRDPLPDRPREWKPHVNEAGGFAVLLPRGWKASNRGPATLIRAYDRLVAVSIAPDRSDAGRTASIEAYATATADRLRGFAGGLQVKGMRPFNHRYRATEVYGEGRASDGVEQKVSVFVLRRDHIATLTAVLAANAKHRARESERIAHRLIKTLRTRPPRSNPGS